MTKTDIEMVSIPNERIENAVDRYGSLKANYGSASAIETLAVLYGSYSVANLLEMAWQERRTLAVTLDMLGCHFEEF